MNRFWDLLLITVFFVFDPKPLFGQNDFLDLNVAAKQEKIRKDGFTDHNQFNEQFDKIRQRSEGAHIENELKWEELRSEALLAYKKDKSRRKKPILVQNESDNDEHFKDYLKEQEKNQRNYDENRRRYIAVRQQLSKQSHPLTPEKELGLEKQRPRYSLVKRSLYGAPQKLGKTQSWTTSGGGASSDGFMPPAPPPSMVSTEFGAPPPPSEGFNSGLENVPPFQENFAPPPLDLNTNPGFSPGAPGFPEGDDFIPSPSPMTDPFGEFPPPPPPDF
jgi:hypothetical protein